MPKMHTFWFMNQAHEPKWENLGKCGLEGTKINTWLRVTQSTLGNSNTSSKQPRSLA